MHLFIYLPWLALSSVQFCHSVVSDSLRPHRLQQATTPCPSSIPSLLKLMPIELVMPSNHFILYHPFLLPSNFPSIRIFSNESALRIRWPKYWSFSFSICPSNEYSGLIGLISLLSKGLLKVFSSTTTQKHQSFSPQSSLWSNSLSLSVFLITDILESMSWYLIVVFIYFPND